MTKSPARRAGLTPRFSDRPTLSSHVLMRVWTPVRLKCDPRHEGEVVASFHNTIRVRWPNGWLSEHGPDELEVCK